MGTITIEIDEKHALVRHIESLQGTLTKRNAAIERLTAQIEAGEDSPLIAEAYARGRTAGWKACAEALISATEDAARSLAKVRKEALDVYRQPVATSSDAAGAE